MVAFTVECKAMTYFVGTIWSGALLALARVAVVGSVEASRTRMYRLGLVLWVRALGIL